MSHPVNFPHKLHIAAYSVRDLKSCWAVVRALGFPEELVIASDAFNTVFRDYCAYVNPSKVSWRTLYQSGLKFGATFVIHPDWYRPSNITYLRLELLRKYPNV